MKLLFAAILPLLAAGPAVRFEKDGVRVGDVLVQGTVLEMRSAAAASMLASGSSLEALSRRVEVEFAPERKLVLDPGVRVTRQDGACVFTAHAGRRLRFEAAGRALSLASPVRVAASAEGWTLDGVALEGAVLTAGLQAAQDETDTQLDKMKQSSSKMRDVNTVQRPNGRTVRVFFMGDPLTSAQAADSVSVRQILAISPSGAP